MERDWRKIDTYAKKWTREAGAMIKDSFQNELIINTKSNADDLVTNMDKEIEQFFIAKIKDRYPSHRIIAEEGYGDEIASLNGVVWIIDPIDGTMNFVHQQRNFAISVAVYENGVGMVGLIYDVVHDELYHALQNEGAYLNETKLSSLSEVPIQEAVIAVNATWVTENKRIDPSILASLVKDVRGTRSYGSAALELAYVAAGRLDAYITMRLSPWDFAAGSILLNEVGGVTTNLNGKPLNLQTQNSVFAAKSSLHHQILTNYLQK